MSEIKALDELRKLASNRQQDWEKLYVAQYEYKKIEEALNEIEHEIDSRYMLLPVDADGVPWHIGEEVDGCEIVAMTGYQLYYYDDGSKTVEWCIAKNRRHIKPRTLEDVLTDFVNEVAREGHQIGLSAPKIIDEYAYEIRELLGGDAK